MNALDGLAISIVGIFAFVGFFRGIGKELLGIAGLVVSSVAAYIFYRSGMGLLMITAVFVISNIVLSLVLKIWQKMRRRDDEGISFPARIAGAAVGSLNGAVMAGALIIFLPFAEGILADKSPAFREYVGGSFLYSRYTEMSRTSTIPELKIAYGLSQFAKLKQGEIAIDPEVLEKLGNNPRIKMILQDETLLKSFEKKDFSKIFMNPKILSLFNDKSLLKELSGLGLPQKVKNTSARRGPATLEVKPFSSERAAIRLEGIAYSESSATVIINGRIYRVGSKCMGGVVSEITSQSITLEFPDGAKEYSVGDSIP